MTDAVFTVGVSRDEIELLLRSDTEIVASAKVDGPEAMWHVSVAIGGGDPVDLFVDNSINSIYIQVIKVIDTENVIAALEAIEPYACVGLSAFSDGLVMRGAFFAGSSNLHALSNTLRSVALAYRAYEMQIAD